MKSFLILATLLTLTACCGCMDKPKTAANADTMMAPAVLACHTAKVSGMTCEACAATVSENLKKIKGVKQVQIDVASETVRIFSVKESDVKTKAVKSIIEKSGYKFNSMQANCN
jgi:copper chaperone CopZ